MIVVLGSCPLIAFCLFFFKTQKHLSVEVSSGPTHFIMQKFTVTEARLEFVLYFTDLFYFTMKSLPHQARK